MKKEKAMALYTAAINSGNTDAFIAELNSEDGYHVLDEKTEQLLLLEGNREMLEYYLKSHVVWGINEPLFKERWPDLFAEQQKRFAR